MDQEMSLLLFYNDVLIMCLQIVQTIHLINIAPGTFFSTKKCRDFSFFLHENISSGTHLKHLDKALLETTHNLCFPGGIRKG